MRGSVARNGAAAGETRGVWRNLGAKATRTSLASMRSVRPGQAEGVLGHVVEDHLARDRRRPAEADAPVQVGQPVLEREAVAAVGLDGLVDAVDRGLGRGV